MEVDATRNHLQLLSTLFFDVRLLNRAQSLIIWLVLLARLFWRSGLCLLRQELSVGCHAHLAFMWVLGIQSSHLHNPCFNQQASSSIPLSSTAEKLRAEKLSRALGSLMGLGGKKIIQLLRRRDRELSLVFDAAFSSGAVSGLWASWGTQLATVSGNEKLRV